MNPNELKIIQNKGTTHGKSFCEYSFEGDIDEAFRYTDLTIGEDEVIFFNLEKVDNLNSCGIREWLSLVKQIKKSQELIYKKCSVVMIDQFNMVPDLLGHGQVSSFYAPYFCQSDGEINIALDYEEVKDSILQEKAPEMNCPKCNTVLEFDALEESYFIFASKLSQPR